MACQGVILWLSSSCLIINTCTRDGHRCQGSEEVGNQGSQQPKASLAISLIQCLTTKERAIKASRSDSLGARHCSRENTLIQHVFPNSLWSHHHPAFALSNFLTLFIVYSPTLFPVFGPSLSLTSSLSLFLTVSLSLSPSPHSLSDLGSILG